MKRKKFCKSFIFVISSIILICFMDYTSSMTPTTFMTTTSTTTTTLTTPSEKSFITDYITNNDYDDFNNFKCFNRNEADLRENHLSGQPKSPVQIQISNRMTHQLMSRIFGIFLKEILGYKHIELIKLPHQDYEELDKLFTTLTSLLPDARSSVHTIDLEVWMHFSEDAWPEQLSEVGLVTSLGRFGWFVPKSLIHDASYKNITDLSNILHYKIFLLPNSEIYKKYIIDDIVLKQIKSIFGFQKEFIPDNCKYHECVTILSEYYEDTGFVRLHINELQLYTKILWIGEKFKFAISWIYKYYINNTSLLINNNKYIILHWTPSNIIDSDIDYDMITMPRCEEMRTSYRTLCKYEMTPLLKYYGSNSRTLTTELRALEKFHIKPNELRKLLIDTNNFIQYNNTNSLTMEMIYNRISCEWLKNHKNLYTKWIDKEPAKIIIGGIFPINVTGSAYKNIVPAAKMAVNAINANKTILPNHELILMEHDGQCKSDIVMKAFISYFKGPSPLIGILGPACSETVEPIAGISKHTRMVVISYSAEGASFIDREAYPYFFRTIGSNRQYEAVYLNLFQRLKWRRISALTEDGQKYTEYITHLETLLKHNDMELIVNKKFPKDITTTEMKRHLLDLKKKNANIIIADIYNHNAQMVMCEAYKLEMTAYHGYVWFLPIWLSKSWMDSDGFDSRQNVSCTRDQLYEAINGHFSLTHTPFAENSSIMQENLTVKQWLNKYNRNIEHLNSSVSDYAGFAYDAVWVYAMAADKLLRTDPTAINELNSPQVVNEFVDIIWKTDFNGVSGRLRFGEGGSRINDINVLQWVDKKFYQVGKYIPEISDDGVIKITGGKLELNESSIIWKNKKRLRPKDGTFVCQLGALAEFFDTNCDNVTMILTTILCLLFVILVSLASFMFWKRQYDKKLKQSAKVMRNFGIDLLSPSSNMSNTLDKWEIPKEKVVINRRLGEGAFGTVYGGEAQISDGLWTAVAVKTLKMGASMEDRLDFLSEAEAMKRFDHENIVKLLGVCLQTEPIYTIMEFMLYGDLKTFLLARRHLVNEKITEDSDISSKRLTMMALDVTRGMSYLAEQKYVHRDIACRNCLVNAQRVVKLGDFGMARPMFENDYYRFNRKGMLPVRWMAPESLALGLFTPSSDVWSFGVLLFEIITFGSFPYQGLTNNQVLEYIKSGKTLEIPHGTKPHLEGLMRACWNQESKKRPTATEIVEYISNYPRLLTPCLDVPISSVQMPETESDQMELLPRIKRRITTQPNIDILSKATNINNFDQRSHSENVDILQDQNDILNFDQLNVPPIPIIPLPPSLPSAIINGLDSNANDDSNINNTTYSPMEPLLRLNPEISNSTLSLRRYVPMYGVAPKKCSSINSPIELENNCQEATSV